jgi:23S rRNA pseudouridine2605 synthase
MRINKFLARSGVASRRRADDLIMQGRVKLNGQPVSQLGVQVCLEKDIVEVDNQVVSPEQGIYYLMLNKPPGYLVSAKDPHHKRLVTSLLKDFRGKVFPVGRLDYDSAVLLIFTNDGTLAFRLTHPRYEVEKTYEVLCSGKISRAALNQMERGLTLDDGPTAPSKVKLLSENEHSSQVLITIHEGRKRQVRRMFAAVGFPVLTLKRVAYGSLKLGTLEPGKFKHISAAELQKLRALVGLK